MPSYKVSKPNEFTIENTPEILKEFLSFVDTKIANDIAQKYQMPAEILSRLFELTQTIDSRNYSIIITCFFSHLLHQNIVKGMLHFERMTDKDKFMLTNEYFFDFAVYTLHEVVGSPVQDRYRPLLIWAVTEIQKRVEANKNEQ